MKSKMIFKFGKTATPIDSETGYYFCELSYRSSNKETATDISKTYLMTRDYRGNWKIVGCDKKLPAWIYQYEKKFGAAIDESLGFISTPFKPRRNRYY
jgi:hypothetical protein